MYDLPRYAPKTTENIGAEVARRTHDAVQKCMATCALACLTDAPEQACLQYGALEARFRQEIVTEGGVAPRFRRAKKVTPNKLFL